MAKTKTKPADAKSVDWPAVGRRKVSVRVRDAMAIVRAALAYYNCDPVTMAVERGSLEPSAIVGQCAEVKTVCDRVVSACREIVPHADWPKNRLDVTDRRAALTRSVQMTVDQALTIGYAARLTGRIPVSIWRKRYTPVEWFVTTADGETAGYFLADAVARKAPELDWFNNDD
jgi:hypothetical protein